MSTPYRSAGEIPPTLTPDEEAAFWEAVGHGDDRASLPGILAAIAIAVTVASLLWIFRT